MASIDTKNNVLIEIRNLRSKSAVVAAIILIVIGWSLNSVFTMIVRSNIYVARNWNSIKSAFEENRVAPRSVVEAGDLMGIRVSYRAKRNLPFVAITYPDNLSPSLYFKNTENFFLEDFRWALEYTKIRRMPANCTKNTILSPFGLCESDLKNNNLVALKKIETEEQLFLATNHDRLKYHIAFSRSKRLAKAEGAVIFLHGNSTNPLKLFSGENDYTNQAGRILNDYGFDVYAPYLFSHSWGNSIVTENGIMNGQGVTSFGIDILKIDSLYKKLRGKYKYIILYGISRGEILARIYMATGAAKVDALVLSGITLDARKYLSENYLGFSPIHYSHEEFLVRDFEALMTHFGYRDWPATLKNVPLILEIDTSNPVAQNSDSIREFTSFLQKSGLDVTYNYFEGFHETNPEITAQLLRRRFKDGN